MNGSSEQLTPEQAFTNLEVLIRDGLLLRTAFGGMFSLQANRELLGTAEQSLSVLRELVAQGRKRQELKQAVQATDDVEVEIMEKNE